MLLFEASPVLLLSVAPACFLLLYAEIHYRFRWIPSRYFHRSPEILADLPRRLDPGEPLPVLLLVKDAHLYPATIHHLEVHIAAAGAARPIFSQRLRIGATVEQHWWHRVFYLDVDQLPRGDMEVRVGIEAAISGTPARFDADNYKLTGKAPFTCFFAEDRLPAPAGFVAGDMHTHSSFTEDQVEFGAPPEATVALARAAGFRVVAVTDHSYDLDDIPGNYLQNDPQLRKWHAFQETVAALNATTPGFVLIPGEEVSCGNGRGENVHFLVLNNPDYLPGKGDGGEKWLRTTPDLTIDAVLDRSAPGALCFAAHPVASVPFLQRLLLRRGCWQDSDLDHPRLDGLQIWNGSESGREAAQRMWVRALLAGKRHLVLAGSDAHGNFNRYRQIRMPHLVLEEHRKEHLFGQEFSWIGCDAAPTLPGVCKAVRAGNTAISTGPFLNITGLSATGRTLAMGGQWRQSTRAVRVKARSSAEFGAIDRIDVICGRIGADEELRVHAETAPAGSMVHTIEVPFAAQAEGPKYFRVELETVRGHRAWTNPIWEFPSPEGPTRRD